MKHIFLILALIIFYQVNSQSQTLDSKVVSAIVYNSGAQVTSEKKVNLNEGTHTLVFKNLSPNIDESSIILNGLEHISLNSISFETDFLNEMASSDVLNDLKSKLKTLERDKVYTQNKMTSLEKSIILLEKNQEIQGKESELNVEKIKAYKNYFADQIETLSNSIYDLSITVQEFNKDIQKLQNEIQKIESDNRVNRGKITVELDVEKAVSPTLSLNYFIYDAGWYASYDLKSMGIDEDIQLIYKAKVYQSSGQDWDDIDLKLSTANPTSDKTKPEIEPYYLDFNRRFQDRLSGQEALNEVVVTSYDLTKRSEVNAAKERQVAETVEQQLSVEFIIPNKVSLASGSDDKQIQLNQHQLPTQYEYYAAPELSNSVFLIAEIKDWKDLNLISGKANLYFENSFLGTTQLNTSSLEDELIVSLGTDENIILERTLPNKKTSQTFFGNNTVVAKAYEIEIKNTKNLAISILVQERLPISRNEDIKIENIEYANATYDEKKGFLNWKFDLQAGEKTRLEYSYSVKYPKDRILPLRP